MGRYSKQVYYHFKLMKGFLDIASKETKIHVKCTIILMLVFSSLRIYINCIISLALCTNKAKTKYESIIYLA